MVGSHRLVILYGVGGLSDVGRHAILAALERTDIERITVLTQYPKLLDDGAKWNCGCPDAHVLSESDKKRISIVSVDSWSEHDKLVPYFKGSSAVVSCLGNRQPFFGHCDSYDGNSAVIDAIHKTDNLKRVVVCSSIGIEEDWPPVEFFKLGRYAMSCIFMTCGRQNFKDLTKMERAYKATSEKDIDYLLIRPVGLTEDVKPVNRWALQKKKFDDVLHYEMAKLDCARYMVEEAIHPTRHREAVVIGGTIDES